ncbi:alpha/beta hydrolase [Bradyrhizobium elkanii]|jgi:acetyl esterase/lipase|uniref:alpha/beta hydrolase n=1 Tax=Bradyrhizobium elkanii TaxID=29448 RepID=UPI0020A08F08|nr:alpha/beta hydrolase [Bradyrhizobium elkanii]MCP1971319.1 acetyl esterase/lipase [Bradyrhizobium elkanii]MCS3518476.1 acetyl esterase/lipase [Bradyrhizobium elkanii]MCS4075031.1 acetyl esterase/lipase [Bradyrhizobium elkanii]MCS4081667.1 acetyl esterase/lipase [Bradyrhizobium elkanii]MCS4107174.1 acetyl esterase/lipase [Bradyrhizobium elkanii]
MAALFSALDWRAMSQEERDLGLNNGVAVKGSAEIAAGWEQRSAALRQKHAQHLDLRYGPRERNRIDFLKARDGAPTLLFIHGGYWQTRAKEVFTIFAEGPMAHGINVALIGYTLAPDATLDDIVAEIHAGIDFLAGQLPALGAAAEGIVVSGWSAGGHLTLMALSNAHVRAGMAISGIYDLEPIRHSYLNEKLKLDEAASRRNSPMMAEGGTAKPLSLVVGSAELPLLRKQTADFAGHRARYGLPVTYEEIAGADHFSIMNQMLAPQGRITTLIRQLFERTASS